MNARWTRTSSASRGRLNDDRGAVAVFVAVLVIALILFAAVALDAARWYVAASELQKAADAAALAGVTRMTNDSIEAFDRASDEARRVAALNGYAEDDETRVTPLTNPQEPSQFGVTISSVVDNPLGVIFGRGQTRLTRTAFADYLGDALIASPCNTFGNEPPGNSAVGPSASMNPNTWPTCQGTEPGFWGAIEGPETAKVQGDRFNTRICRESGSAVVYRCSTTSGSGQNLEYFQPTETVGNFFVLRVGAAAVGKTVTVQAFDPAYVEVGSYCNDYSWTPLASMNPFAPDSATRYATGNGTVYCTGDSDPGGGSGQNGMTTSFVMRWKTPTLNPRLGSVISGCVKQFGAVTSPPSRDNLRSSQGSYNEGLAEVWRQWVTLCQFTPTEQGDYYLQVRTNASTSGGSTDGLITSNSPNAYADASTTTSGRGSNGFGLRAFVGTTSSTASSSDSAALSLAGYQRVAMLQNKNIPAGNVFNLVQIEPNAAGRSFTFDLFDAGDGSDGTLTVLPPTESTGLSLTNCRYEIFGTSDVTPTSSTTNSTGCSFTIATSAGQGRLLKFTVPIPSTYTCNGNSAGGCWFRIRISWTNQPTDFTTWTARVRGDTIRLVQ